MAGRTARLGHEDSGHWILSGLMSGRAGEGGDGEYVGSDTVPDCSLELHWIFLSQGVPLAPGHCRPLFGGFLAKLTVIPSRLLFEPQQCLEMTSPVMYPLQSCGWSPSLFLYHHLTGI